MLVRDQEAVNLVDAGAHTINTTPAFTPPSGALLVAILSLTWEGGPTPPDTGIAITDSEGLTWTLRASQFWPNSFYGGVMIWTAVAPAAVSMTVSVTDSDPQFFYSSRVEVYSYTGYDAAGPVGVVFTHGGWPGGGQPGGPWADVLPGVPVEGSEVLASARVDWDGGSPNSMAAGVGWTSIEDLNGVSGICDTQVRAGDGIWDGVSWTTVVVDGGSGTSYPDGFVAVAVEILPAAAVSDNGFFPMGGL